MADAPAVHIRREYGRPPSFREAIKRYMHLTRHFDHHGVDPVHDQRRQQLLAHGPVAISPIAVADAPLEFGRVVVDQRRRLWRFRACDMTTGRCIFQRFVEAETLEEARIVGARRMTDEWDAVLKATDNKPPAALVGSAIAI